MKVQHSIVNNNKLNSVPVVNGQIVYVKDTHDLYFDVDNTRTKATDIVFVGTLQERDAIQSPTPNKVYCVEEDNKFYRYENNEWVLVGGEEPLPQVFLWTYTGSSITSKDLEFWNNILLVNDKSDVIVLYDLAQNGVILRIYKGDLRKNKRTEYGYTTDISNQSTLSEFKIDRIYVTVTITNDIITAVNLSQTSSNKSFYYLSPSYDYATPYIPLYDGSPATKKYVNDSLASYTPPATDVEFDNTGTEIEATTVEEAIIELNTKIGNLNTLIEEINGE